MPRKKVTPRKLARSVVKHQLDKNGVTGYNKTRTVDGAKFPSRFAAGWRDAAIKVAEGGKKSNG